MKNLFKRIAITALAFCFCVCFSGVLNAAEFSQSNLFTVFLNSENVADLSGVTVQIYKKINISAISDGLTTFDVECVGSATSDSRGRIRFERPEGPFMIEFDLKTLPSGTGVKKHRISYHLFSNQSDTVDIYSIVSAEAHLAGDSLNFCFKNSENENLLVNYEIDSHSVTPYGSEKSSAKMLAEKYSGDIDCTLIHSGSVNANGALLPYSVEESYSDLDYLQYISLLCYNDCVTIDEQTLMLCGFLESEYGEGYRTAEMRDILEMLKSESSDVNVQNNINEELNRISAMNASRDSSELESVQREFFCAHGDDCCEGGIHNIMVYYSPSALPNIQAIATEVADVVLDVMDYFINQLGFKCPKSVNSIQEVDDTGGSFCVVLAYRPGEVGSVTWGTRYLVGNQTEQAAYIYLNYAATGKFGTGIAHELQHCIQNQYKLDGPGDVWWKEACANWASLLYAEEVLGDLSTRWGEYNIGIGAYLESTMKSLANNCDYRVYSVLFPEFLSQMYHGATTIRSIYEEAETIRANTAARTHQQIFTAINNVIEESSNYDLRFTLEYFGKANSYPLYYYHFLQDNFNETPRATRYNLSLSNSYNYDIEAVGYGYYMINPASDTVSMLIETDDSYYSDYTCWIIEGYGENTYVEEYKCNFSYNMLFLDYTFESSSADYVLLIVENTSIVNNSSIFIEIY